MDTLLAAFEDIIDSVGDRQYEVEYSVCSHVMNILYVILTHDGVI